MGTGGAMGGAAGGGGILQPQVSAPPVKKGDIMSLFN